MDDQEMLKMAAAAAGVKVAGSYEDEATLVIKPGPGLPRAKWNPLADDGDALRLAVKLRLSTDFVDGGLSVYRHGETDFIRFTAHDDHDHYAATRRAIVRAAAEIGHAGGEMIHHVTDTERKQSAEIERLRAALLSVTDALDKMGDMSDGDVSPRAWRLVGAENLITMARAAMKEQP